MSIEKEIGPKDQKRVDFLTSVLPGTLRDGAKECAQRAQQLTANGDKTQQLQEFLQLYSSILSQAADNLDKAYQQTLLQPAQLQETSEEAVGKGELKEPESPKDLFNTLIKGRVALHSIKVMLNKEKFNPRDTRHARKLRSEFNVLDGYLKIPVPLQENSIKGFEEILTKAKEAYDKIIEEAENFIYGQVDAKSADLRQKRFDQMVSELAVEAVRVFPYDDGQSFEDFISSKIDDAIEAAHKNSHSD